MLWCHPLPTRVSERVSIRPCPSGSVLSCSSARSATAAATFKRAAASAAAPSPAGAGGTVLRAMFSAMRSSSSRSTCRRGATGMARVHRRAKPQAAVQRRQRGGGGVGAAWPPIGRPQQKHRTSAHREACSKGSTGAATAFPLLAAARLARSAARSASQSDSSLISEMSDPSGLPATSFAAPPLASLPLLLFFHSLPMLLTSQGVWASDQAPNRGSRLSAWRPAPFAHVPAVHSP